MTLFRSFLILLSQEFKIPIKDIENEWNAVEEGYTSYYPYNKVIIHLCNDVIDNIGKNESAPIPIPIGKNEKKCLHEFVRSAKKGTLCGERVTSLGDFCNKHKKQHGIVCMKDESKTIPDEKYDKDDKKKDKNTKKNKKNKKKEKTNEDQEIKDIEPDLKKPIAIRLNYKINRYIHPDSGMTFFSKDEKVVFARFDKHNTKLIKLTAEDIILCKMYGFRVDPNKWDVQNFQES